MKSLLYEIKENRVWNDYLEFKRKQASISKKELEELAEYILNKKYQKIVNQILQGKYTFSIPEKHLINKINKAKKRVVYNFNYDENMVLKVITFLFSKKYRKRLAFI